MKRSITIGIVVTLMLSIAIIPSLQEPVEASDKRTIKGESLDKAMLPTNEQIRSFVNDLNAERFYITSDEAKTVTGPTNFTDGVIVSGSPEWWKWLGKGVLVAATTVAGTAIKPGIGTAIGAHTGVHICELINAEEACSPGCVVDVGLFERIEVPTMGDIIPTIITIALNNPIAIYDLDHWNEKVPGTDYSITFTDSFSGKVVDVNGVEKPGVYAIGFVITEAISGERLFGFAYFNTMGNLEFSDRFLINFGIIPDNLIDSPVNYTAWGLISYPNCPPKNEPCYPRHEVGEQNPDGSYQVTIVDELYHPAEGRIKKVVAKVDGVVKFEADDIGQSRYKFSFSVDLSPGEHTLTIEAWDCVDRHMQKEVELLVEPPLGMMWGFG